MQLWLGFSSNMKLVSGWRRYLHFDFHVLQVLLQRGWQIIAGGITVLIVPLSMTAAEQGYYFTFSSLLALQVFFELGLNFVVTQMAGHEAAKLNITEDGRIDGDPGNAARLMSLIAVLRRWYRIAAPIFAVILMVAGFFFFQREQTLPLQKWVAAWLLLVVFTAVNLYFSSRLAVLEGIGRVGAVARLRLHQSVVGMLLMWAGLTLGWGLFSVPLVSGTAALGTWLWLRRYGSLRIPPELADSQLTNFNWRRDIFPLQWKIALSWLSGWFIFNAFTPMLFAHQGAVEAGRVGLAITMFTAISTMGMAWVNAAAPQFMRLIALGERAALNKLFKKVLASNASFVTLASLMLLGSVAVLKPMNVAIVARVASLPVLTCLALVAIANSFIFAVATYMRAHKEEPMLVSSVVVAIIIGPLAWFGSKYGSLAMMAAYATTTLCLALPWALILFFGYYRRSDSSLQK